MDEEKQVTARDTISDLENVICGEDAQYDNTNESDILKFFKGKISYEEYVCLKTPINIIKKTSGQV